jgi:hypothetical protein
MSISPSFPQESTQNLLDRQKHLDLDIKAKMGIAANVDLTSSRRPAWLIMDARHPGKQFATASTKY